MEVIKVPKKIEKIVNNLSGKTPGEVEKAIKAIELTEEERRALDKLILLKIAGLVEVKCEKEGR